MSSSLDGLLLQHWQLGDNAQRGRVYRNLARGNLLSPAGDIAPRINRLNFDIDTTVDADRTLELRRASG